MTVGVVMVDVVMVGVSTGVSRRAIGATTFFVTLMHTAATLHVTVMYASSDHPNDVGADHHADCGKHQQRSTDTLAPR